MFTRDLGLIAQRLDLLAQDGVRHRGEGRAGLVHCSVVPGAPAIVADDFAGLLVDAIGVSELFGKPGQIGDDGMDMALRVGRPARVIDRQSVVQGKSVSVRVDLGGRGLIKKKTTKMYNRMNNMRYQ